MNIDPFEFRKQLGTFPTGVCIIGVNPDEGEPFGLTINSFTSLSLDPALILWSLKEDSNCLEAIQKEKKFSVNILSSDQESLSNIYSKKGEHVLAKEHFYLGEAETPVIFDALTTFECDLWNSYPGGDHSILVGKVLSLKTDSTKSPLLFHSGKYKLLE